MRILALCPYVPFPPTHGGRIRSGVVLAALRALGEVEVAAPAGPDDREAVAGLEAALGIRVHALPAAAAAVTSRAPSRKLARWMRGRSDVMWRRWTTGAVAEAHRLVRTQGADLVVVETGFAIPLLPPSVALTRGIRVIFSTHNVEAEVLARMGGRGLAGRIEAGLVARHERRLTASAALTLAVSTRDQEMLVRAFPRARVEVVENSVDLAVLERLPPKVPASPAAAPRLLFVGSFDYPPNREAARELLEHHLPALRTEWPELGLRLVGRDPSGEVAARSAQVAGAEFVGFVEDLTAEYAAADAVYIPLRSGGGTRIKVLEAFALGRPVIATDLAVEGLPVRPGREYSSCEHPKEGVASLRRVMSGDAAGMVDRSRTLVEQRFSHAAAGARIIELVRSVL